MDTDKEEQSRRQAQHRFPEPQSHPWLCYLHGRRSHIQTFCSLSEGEWQNRYIPEMRKRKIDCSLHGWLILTHQFDENDCVLLNPISMKKIQLPPLPGFFNLCSLSSAPEDPTCMIMFIHWDGHLAYCKPGDDSWTTQQLKLEYNENLEFSDYIKTVGVYHRQIYMLTYFDKLLVVEFDPCFKVTDLEVKRTYPPCAMEINPQQRKWFLVESRGELFMIDQCFLTTEKVAFYIYHINLEQKKWIIVEGLEDRAFFLGSSHNALAVTCSTDGRSNVKGDTIYFTRSDEKGLYAFDLKDKTLVVYSPPPNVILNWIPPEWALPLTELN